MQIEIKGKCPTINNLLNSTACHWAKRKAIKDQIKEEVYWAFYQIENKPKLPFEKKVDIIFTAYYKDKRRRDVDGLNSKYHLDGLVDCGVLIDDSVKYVKSIKYILEIGQQEDKIIIDIL